MSIFAQLRRVWWKLPAEVREFGPLARAKRAVKSQLATHDDIYTEAYYSERREGAQASAGVIAASIVEAFHPTDVLDVGCGTGDLVKALIDLGVWASGLEYSDAAIALCINEGLVVRKFDLERDALADSAQPDVITSTEVAEHLPATCADRYVDLLTRAKRAVIFTAAAPGQGGTDHVNEQPNEYWIEKFSACGFVLNRGLTDAWRARWRERGTLDHYYNNLLVFVRRES